MTSVKRLSSIAALVLGLSVAWCGLARAGDCSAQTGKKIYEDSFKDGAGGFEQDDQAKFGPSGLQMTLGKTEDNWIYVNNNATATNADYCVVATVPAPVSDDNLAAIGMAVLYVDNDNMIGIYVYSDNTVQVERRTKGDATFLINEEKDEVKADVGSTISIRAVVQNGMLTTYVNGVAMKAVPVEVVETANHFGVYVGVDKVADKETAFTFKSISITDGKK